MLRRDVVVLWIAARDRRVSLPAKLVAGMVAAYALSPIDLIPDFIPILGYLDDLIIVPLGIMLAIRLIPPDLMRAFRKQADERSNRPISRVGAVLVAALWIAGAVGMLWLLGGI